VTFDLQDISFDRLTMDLCTRAKVREEFNKHDETSTVYIGGTKSPWEVRISSRRFRLSRKLSGRGIARLWAVS
jgi:hypothetical protein